MRANVWTHPTTGQQRIYLNHGLLHHDEKLYVYHDPSDQYGQFGVRLVNYYPVPGRQNPADHIIQEMFGNTPSWDQMLQLAQKAPLPVKKPKPVAKHSEEFLTAVRAKNERQKRKEDLADRLLEFAYRRDIVEDSTDAFTKPLIWVNDNIDQAEYHESVGEADFYEFDDMILAVDDELCVGFYY